MTKKVIIGDELFHVIAILQNGGALLEDKDGVIERVDDLAGYKAFPTTSEVEAQMMAQRAAQQPKNNIISPNLFGK